MRFFELIFSASSGIRVLAPRYEKSRFYSDPISILCPDQPSDSGLFYSCRKTHCVKRLCETLPTFQNYPESLFGERLETILDENLPEILRSSARGDLPRRMGNAPPYSSWRPSATMLSNAPSLEKREDVFYVCFPLFFFGRRLSIYSKTSA